MTTQAVDVAWVESLSDAEFDAAYDYVQWVDRRLSMTDDQVQTPKPGAPEPKPPTEEAEPALEPADGPQTITITEPTIIVPNDEGDPA